MGTTSLSMLLATVIIPVVLSILNELLKFPAIIAYPTLPLSRESASTAFTSSTKVPTGEFSGTVARYGD